MGNAWTDVRVEARMRVTQFGGETRAYLCGRYQDGNNFYAASLYNRSEGGMIELRRKFNKNTKNLARANMPRGLEEGKWYKVALELRGNTINVFVDDELLLTATDDKLGTGSVGLIAYKSMAQFDDVAVTPLESATE